MHPQAKQLRLALKAAHCTYTILGKDRGIKVKTIRRYSGRDRKGKAYYEYGAAMAHIDLLTAEQVEIIKTYLPCRIINIPSNNKTIIYSI